MSVCGDTDKRVICLCLYSRTAPTCSVNECNERDSLRPALSNTSTLFTLEISVDTNCKWLVGDTPVHSKMICCIMSHSMFNAAANFLPAVCLQQERLLKHTIATPPPPPPHTHTLNTTSRPQGMAATPSPSNPLVVESHDFLGSPFFPQTGIHLRFPTKG